jgi:diguanylate cyclase (GGDEF)-like protein/PAS domain S-box-containing protein
MLRVTLHENEDKTELILEGRIVGPWATELSVFWKQKSNYLSSKTLCLNLCNVTYADDEGLRILREICTHPSLQCVANTLWSHYLAQQVAGPAVIPVGVKEAATGPAHRVRYPGQQTEFKDAPSLLSFMLETVAERERARDILDCISDAIICTDVAGNITLLNRAAEKLMGLSPQEAAGKNIADAFKAANPSIRKTILDLTGMAATESLAGHLPPDGVFRRRDREGGIAEDYLAPIRNHAGEVTGSLIMFRDVSATRELVSKLAHAAYYDHLTGLPNRALLNDRLQQAILIAKREQRPIALLFLDIDGFKQINDTFGHAVGDKVLQSVAERLRRYVRAPDTVCRSGGDEFIVLLQNFDSREDVVAATMRLLEVMAEIHFIDNHEIYAPSSIGVSLSPAGSEDAETIIKNADAAMYSVKRSGRHNYRFFLPENSSELGATPFTEVDLFRAFEKKEFTLLFQPKVDLKTGKINGAEALVRWLHPTRGLVLPDSFITVAERTGQILELGDWVLREACMQARQWLYAGLPVTKLTVNVSEFQLRHKYFSQNLLETLTAIDFNPELLELDIPERILMRDSENISAALRTLKEKGVRVSADNFGTADCSLKKLHQLSLDAIKIDTRFVRGINRDSDKTFVSAMIGAGHKLNLKVVGEGVETAGDLEFLRTHDCDEGQGNYFSPPIPSEQFGRLLQVYQIPG